MSWKIKKITIENFKYFHQSFDVDVNSRNLLVYGENGSGKSSIYWALYTLFQSRLKPTDADVEKYFDATHGENLRNKYSATGDPSKVVVTFADDSVPPAADKIYTIESGNMTTRQPMDSFLDFTVASSDFLNYKMLSKLTDKENSVVNDVTDLFVKEIYPFVYFPTDYVDLDGNHTGDNLVLHWHQYIESSKSLIRHQRGRRHNQFDTTDDKYTHYKTLIRDFRDHLANFLADLSLRATAKLENDFDIKDVALRFETDPTYDFDLRTAPRSKYRDHTLHPLHIRLHAKLRNAQLAGGTADVFHLRTFYNEAKLTCIGLAIRLAVVDSEYVPGSNLASVLCLDDMLISLDMSYRVPVTKALLKYAQNYQLCFFTHDRSLYNMMKDVIKELGYSKDDWLQLEFFRSNPAEEATVEPKVIWIEPKEGKEKINEYMIKGDYPAAGNCLRKYAEELIKGVLPLNHTYSIKNTGETKTLTLRPLFDKTKATGSDDFCTLYGVLPTDMPDISKHLDRLMNPLSHDDKDVPIYRRELDDALAEIEKYEPIRDGKKVIVKRNEAGVRQFRMEMNNAGVIMSVDFVTTEQWDYIVFPAPIAAKKYKDCEIQIKASSVGTYPVDSKVRVKWLYHDMCNRVFHGPVGAPAFDHSITEIATGTLLSAM